MMNTQEAERRAVKECKKLYPVDSIMQPICGIIAMTAIEAYQRNLRMLKRKIPQTTDEVTK